jgi:hypothetical protein
MKRRGFFTGIAGMITGTAVAQVPEDKKLLELAPFGRMPAVQDSFTIKTHQPQEPYAALTWDIDGDDRNVHVRLSNGSSVVWHQDGKAYKLIPTKSICTMPFKECGLAHQINLTKSIFMLEEV